MKHLTEEQKSKLNEAAYNFVINVVSGFEAEILDVKEFDDVLQRELIEPFIEPLINGKL
jgi:hypothetical protein